MGNKIYKMEGRSVVFRNKSKHLRKKHALDLSIAKWQYIVDRLERGADVPNCGGGNSCALCLYYSPEAHALPGDCIECPIYKDTGKQYCEDTPYEGWAQHEGGWDYSKNRWRKHWAKKMLAYLKGLKP